MKSKKFLLRIGHVIESVVPGLLTCSQADEFIDDYLEGQLTPKVRARFERHLKMCPPCRTYLESYRRSVALTKISAQDSATARMPEDLIKAILAARDTPRQ